MRISYVNQIDDLTASQITALTENSQYPATNLKDQRLTTQWWSTSPTSQTIIFNAGGGPDAEGHEGQWMGQATTNLVTDPENLSSANWTKTAVTVATVTSIVGYPAYSATATTAVSVLLCANAITAATHYSIVCTVRENGSGEGRVMLYNVSAAAAIFDAQITFATKAITYANGTVGFVEWIDDDTVRIAGVASAVSTVGNAIRAQLYPAITINDTDSCIYSTPMFVANSFPLAYTATTRAAWATSGTIAYRLPPSGKFIVDCEFMPYFAYNTSVNHRVVQWYAATAKSLYVFYASSIDKFALSWQDGTTTAQTIVHTTAFDAGTAQTVNQRLRIVASIDVATSGVTTGSRLFVIPRTQGSLQEATTWSQAIDALSSSTFTSMTLGHYANGTQLAGMMFGYRIYGGTLTETITTEAELDTALESRQLTYAQEYQGTFDFNTVALMGHNISEEAELKVEANDWNEWNYVDGSGSSIIQQALTWYQDTPILYFWDTIKKRQYVKFTVNDPNNDDAAIHIGRVWIGDYATIDPSSLLDFKVTKKRSDRTIYGINRQKWSDVGVGWRRFEFKFPPTETTTLNIIQTLYDTVGNHSSFIFANFDSIRDFVVVEPCYVSVDGEIDMIHKRNMKFEYGFALEEDR